MEINLSANNGDLVLNVKVTDKLKSSSNTLISYTITVNYDIQKLVELYSKNPSAFMYYQIKHLIKDYSMHLTLNCIEELTSNKEHIRQAIIKYLTDNNLISKDLI